MIEEFDLINAPLEGASLIEAGAGTGKTYNIAGLYIRLLLEKNLSVDQILVVTFTIAATEELKSRIRHKISEAITALKTGRCDDFTLERLIRQTADRETASGTLETALRQFDEAAIYTIHGFCRKMLHDYAFESRNLFSTGFEKDQSPMLRQAINDFWRKYISNQSPEFIAYLNGRDKEKLDSPEALLRIVDKHYSKSYLKIVPETKTGDLVGAESDFQAAFEIVKSSWPDVKGEISEILLNGKELNRTKYKKDSVSAWLSEMDNLLSSPTCSPVLFKNFQKFTSSTLNGSLRKDADNIKHVFFDHCENLHNLRGELADRYEQNILGLKFKLFEFVNAELKKLKKASNVQHYDDLLEEFRLALHGSVGKHLAKTIRHRFQAALIDEFQDTDPIQYDIFKTIYAGKDAILFLIGDPKQAIYSFRGADIFAYIDSIKRVNRRYTLSTNWRSQPELITATNSIFGSVARPFVYDEIPFLPATPAEKENREFLKIEGLEKPPLQVWFFDTRKIDQHKLQRGFIKKEDARDIIARSVTAEIAGLLTLADKNEITLGSNHFKASDIAVLVRTNDEASLIKENLSKAGIPGVLYSDKSVFQSDEARQMLQVLNAIADFSDDRLIRGALSTDMIGLAANEIYSLGRDDAAWEEWLKLFRDYFQLWDDHGFIGMFRAFLVRHAVRRRLLSLPDGERRLTNILHLAELLHRQAMTEKLNVVRLAKWLALQIDSPNSVQDDHQLRLESDETAVRIITIHKSKGLEYPIVFCPFAWGGSRIRTEQDFLFHDRDDEYRPTLDLGSADRESHKCDAELESLAENLRLLYVALTRSRYRCYLAWGLINKAGSSALSYLLHHPPFSGSSNILDDIELNYGGLSDDLVREILTGLSRESGGTLELKVMPVMAAEKYSPTGRPAGQLRERLFRGTIDREWRISSFSSLTSKRKLPADIPDHDMAAGDVSGDETGLEQPAAEEPAGIFAFPRGATAGTFCHDLFENLDFVNTDDNILKKMVEPMLGAYGYDLSWTGTVMSMVKNVLDKSLPATEGTLRLARIPKRDCLNELEFHFPLNKLTAAGLADVFTEHRIAGLKNGALDFRNTLDFGPVKGFMKGYIDLVFQFDGRFYIVDWKSNHLGNSHQDYNPGRMAESMAENRYFLQYHIYAAALHKYLMTRLPDYDYDRDFGGVYYLFLRGIDSAAGDENGVYFDRPEPALIEKLNCLLIPRGTVYDF